MLTFSPTPIALWTGLAFWLLVALLAVLAWHRSPRRKRTAVLESLRLTAVTLIMLLLWQPEWRSIIHPDRKPTIAVLWDDSASMQTVDATLPASLARANEVVSRADWVKQALDAPFWQPLRANSANEWLIQPFASPDPAKPSLSGTDLTAPLSQLLDADSNLRAVVLFSDGDANLGDPPVAAAQKLRLRGVPLFAVPVGAPNRLPDLELLSVSAPTYGIVGENVQIPFTIRSSLDRQVRTTVRLRDETGREHTREVTLPPHSETYDSILWRVSSEGSATLELSFPVADGERVSTNNQRKFTMSGKPEKIRVLVIDTLPRWEYRFLRNALSRDPGVELSCLLFHPDLGPGGGKHYLQSFPESPAELATFDVIFLGDVGTGQLTKDQCGMIHGLVEHQASGVVFLPGAQGNQFSLLDTPLADLLPVMLDETQRDGHQEALASPLSLTTEGRASLLTMLGNDERENPEIWRRLPGFFWHAPVIKAKAGTDVLAVHGNKRGKFGPVPLLVTKSAGSGKVLFMGIDSAWRWRRGVEDLYHYRFWGQVARWMSYQRNMAAGQRVRLFFNPERPEPGQSVTLHANAFDPNGAPLTDGKVCVDVTAPDGRATRVDLEKNDSSWGAFSGRLKVDLPGAWKLRASTGIQGDPGLETTLLAQGTSLEKTGQPARPEILAEMARITRGRVIQPQQIDELAREISALPDPRPLEVRRPLGSHWAVLALLTFLLASFWAARKWHGAF